MERRRILIIEGEKRLADDLKKNLLNPKSEVVIAYDEKIALQLLAAKFFDLVVLDADSIGKGIDDFLRVVRQHNNQTPVIVISSAETVSDKLKENDANVLDFISKPIEIEAFLLKIKELLNNSASEQPEHEENILSAADLIMNLDSGEVARAGKRIDLTEKEFQLLEYMLRNKNRVLSRTTLALNVWKIDFDTKTNVVDVYISYLRNKVDKQFKKKLIATHVGMGYVLREDW